MTDEEMKAEFDRIGYFHKQAKWHHKKGSKVIEVIFANEEYAVIGKYKNDGRWAYFLSGMKNGEYIIQPLRKGDLKNYNFINIKKKWD